jgi:hypothetical protein
MDTTNNKRGRKPKYNHILILHNLNAREIYKKFKSGDIGSNSMNLPLIEYSDTSKSNKVNIHSEFRDTNDNQPVTELTRKTQIVNLDPLDHKFLTMKDYVSCGCLPERTDICCWHCRGTFTTSPIGIPIKYVPPMIKKNNVGDKSNKNDICINDYFLTNGVFCSFPCCLAYIKEHSSESLYRNSISLLKSLYYKLYNTEFKINAAPSWQVLKDYGGKLTLEEFRNSFCTSKFIITQNIKRPYMVAVGTFIEEKKLGYI